jgi:biotin-(acetyl-CoA carboxylase) ligase
MVKHTEQQKLDLPPGFQAVSLREHRDAFTHAQAIADAEGAGTLVWVRRFDTVEAAVVLEPELPLAQARCALFAGMNALADALGQFCPPERPIEFSWPGTILLDGGIIGGCRLAEAPGSMEQDIPDWLVLGFCVRSTVQMPYTQTFDRGTSLEAEGFEIMDGGQILESFTRHLMAGFDGWRATGIKTVAERFLARMPEVKGLRRGLDVNGDLLERRLANVAEVKRTPLTENLSTPQWLDPATGEPWL